MSVCHNSSPGRGATSWPLTPRATSNNMRIQHISISKLDSYNRLFNFIKQHNILYKYKFGFKEKHGTTSALIVLTDKIATAISEGNLVV